TRRVAAGAYPSEGSPPRVGCRQREGGGAAVRIVDVDPVADRAGWLKRRRDGLGGSDVAKVLGISGFGSPWSVYVEKIGAVEPDALEPTDQQVRGRYV